MKTSVVIINYERKTFFLQSAQIYKFYALKY